MPDPQPEAPAPIRLRQSLTTRQGRKVPRMLYQQQGPEPADDDPIVGLVDTPELAALIVAAVNRDAITQADLAEALDGFWLTVAGEGRRIHGQIADPDEAASVLLATLGRIAAERSPDEPAESPQEPAAAPVASDPGKDVAEAQGRAREDAGASAKPPVAAAFDRAAVREITRMAIGRYWNHDPLGCDDHPAAERVTLALWPLLEHAQQALSSDEGVRLWMLDCGELVAKHRARAEAAEAKLAEIAAFWLCTDEDGDIILNAPCADTLGCLWSSSHVTERVTLGELIAAAGTHTGMAAGEMHAGLAVATGQADDGPPNGGNPVIYSGAVAPGGWVCAVPVPGNPDQICGMPVESEPCTEHREAGNG